MVWSGLKMLYQIVSVSMDNFITLTVPSSSFEKEQVPTSISEILSEKMDVSYFHHLSEVAFVHLHLAHYRNQLLHLFVEDAMMALCLAPTEISYGKFLHGIYMYI